MKKIFFLVLFAVLAIYSFGKAPWENGKLKVSNNGPYLQHENGTAFFWQGDTGWLLFQRLKRDEVRQYFQNRSEKGFNVIQSIFFQFYSDKNVYGHAPFEPRDITKPIITPGKDPNDTIQYDYWDHVEYIIDMAAEYGIYISIVPTWRDLINKDDNMTPQIAETFIAHLANYFKDKPNIIWINGGSSNADIKTEIWETMGATLKKNAPNHLVAFHPFGRMQSSTWFQNASWLDVNMFASGHRTYEQDNSTQKYGEDNWRYVLDDISKSPLKPTLDGEPSYEDLPQGLHDPMQPYWDASDVRRYAYWSVFAGACGHVYGQNTVRQIHIAGVNKAESGAKLSFFKALDAPGSFQMQHLRNLVLSRPYFERVNDQSVVSGDEGDKYERIMISRGNDYLMAYTFTGREFSIQMGKISGKKVNAWWYDTRTGDAHAIGSFNNSGIVSFDPPGTKYNGNDWVLVLDNASKKFAKPGIVQKKK